MVGRNFHNYWAEGKFKPIKIDNSKKNGAVCLICKIVLKNTTKSRLVAHRYGIHKN